MTTMTTEHIATQILYERSATTLDIPLTDEDGEALQAASVQAITAQFRSLDTGADLWETPRDIASGLDDGTLSVDLTSDDLAMVTSRSLERRTLTISIQYATDKERHIAVPCELRRVIGAYDMTP
jgi:hypothetical protein